MISYTLVVFTHNTVKFYKTVYYYNCINYFIQLSKENVKSRADLDIRPDFITYSDDENMVQLIGPINLSLKEELADKLM